VYTDDPELQALIERAHGFGMQIVEERGTNSTALTEELESAND
jgi:hypothetical protein